MRNERHEAMLDAALRILHRDAALGLVSLLSVEKVIREAGLPATARRDWEGSRGAGLLTALADERINATQPATTGEFDTDTLSAYPSRDEGDFAAWFLGAMTEYQQIGLEGPTTIASLLLNIVGATSSALAADGASANALAGQIAEGRRAYYRTLTENYAMLFDQMLADMGRRPIAGMDTATMIRLNQSIHEGALMRRFLEPDAFGDGTVVAQAQLVMLDAFTEPVATQPDHLRDPLAWVAEMAPSAALACDKNPLTVAGVASELDRRSDGAIGTDLLEDLLVKTYRTDVELWDVTLRWRLPSIAAAFQVRGLRSDSAVLRIVLRRLSEVADTHPGLVAAVCAGGLSTDTAYVATLIETVTELLVDLDAPEPSLLAPRLVELALEGHYHVISALLGATDLPEPPGGWA